MAIPGVTPELPLRAKVRIGSKNADGYPVSLDHFVSEDADFPTLAGDARPMVLRVRFPYKTRDEVFPSGLEKWMRGRTTDILGCYTKGDGIAHRLGKERDANGLVILDPTPGSERLAMPCAAQQCPYYGKAKNQGCRPKARLNFFIVGDSRSDSVWRFETQSLNTYEQIAGVLGQHSDLRLGEFLLTVHRITDANHHYPVVYLSQAPGWMEPGDGGAVPAAAPSGEGSETGDGRHAAPGSPSPTTASPRQRCRVALVQLDQWPPSESVVEWIKKVGVDAASAKLEARLAEQAGLDS